MKNKIKESKPSHITKKKTRPFQCGSKYEITM